MLVAVLVHPVLRAGGGLRRNQQIANGGVPNCGNIHGPLLAIARSPPWNNALYAGGPDVEDTVQTSLQHLQAFFEWRIAHEHLQVPDMQLWLPAEIARDNIPSFWSLMQTPPPLPPAAVALKVKRPEKNMPLLTHLLKVIRYV